MRASASLGLLGSIALAAICALGAACIIVVDDDDDRGTCERNGRRYEVGEVFPAGDGCNTCECRRGGEYACSLIACPLDAGGPTYCELDGQRYEVGEVFPRGDGCNSCLCNPDGGYSCTAVWCVPDAGAPTYCELNGQRYQVGETFPAGDGCNTCFCGQSNVPGEGPTVGCTLRACPDAGP
jgi:hypothetical protein